MRLLHRSGFVLPKKSKTEGVRCVGGARDCAEVPCAHAHLGPGGAWQNYSRTELYPFRPNRLSLARGRTPCDVPEEIDTALLFILDSEYPCLYIFTPFWLVRLVACTWRGETMQGRECLAKGDAEGKKQTGALAAAQLAFEAFLRARRPAVSDIIQGSPSECHDACDVKSRGWRKLMKRDTKGNIAVVAYLCWRKHGKKTAGQEFLLTTIMYFGHYFILA